MGNFQPGFPEVFRFHCDLSLIFLVAAIGKMYLLCISQHSGDNCVPGYCIIHALRTSEKPGLAPQIARRRTNNLLIMNVLNEL